MEKPLQFTKTNKKMFSSIAKLIDHMDNQNKDNCFVDIKQDKINKMLAYKEFPHKDHLFPK